MAWCHLVTQFDDGISLFEYEVLLKHSPGETRQDLFYRALDLAIAAAARRTGSDDPTRYRVTSVQLTRNVIS